MKIKDSELKAILAEVEMEVSKLVKAEAEKLSKAHPGEETQSEVEPDASATAPAPEASSPAPAPAESAPADGSADAGPPADAAEASGAPDASADPAMDEAMDPEALKGEYAKLSPDALKAHYIACKAALMEVMGGGGEASAPAAAPPAPPPAAPMAPPPEASAPPALKAEMKINAEANGGKELPIKKAEAEIEVLKTKLAATEGAVQGLVKAMEMALTNPKRKAITSTSFIPKSEETAKQSLSKSEVMTKLNQLSASAGLKKSDRELINAYCVGTVGVEKIEHLLTDK